jgi:dolichol-phosphate mannosyltransferase
MADRSGLLVFVPTFNEATNVEAIVQQLEALALGPDLLFIDDASPDGTGAILDRLAASSRRLTVIHREGRLGIGSAHTEAIAWAYERGYRMLVTMDCDHTHPPALVPSLAAAADRADIVIGSRYLRAGSMPGWSLLRRSLTLIAHRLTTSLLGLPHDATTSFRLYRLDRIPRANFDGIRSRTYSFFLESLFLLRRSGVSIVEVPVVLAPRRDGSSKMTLGDVVESVRTLLRLTLSGAGGRR